MRDVNKMIAGCLAGAILLYLGLYLGRTEIVGNLGVRQTDGSFLTTKWYRISKTQAEVGLYAPAAWVESKVRGQPESAVYGPP
jgi:hypothetical protein